MSGHLINCESTVEDSRNTSCSIGFSFLFTIYMVHMLYLWVIFIKLNMCGDKPNIKAAFSTINFSPPLSKETLQCSSPSPMIRSVSSPCTFLSCHVPRFIFGAYIHIHIRNSGVVTHKCWIICNSACLRGNFYFAFKSVTRRCLRWEKRERTIAL